MGHRPILANAPSLSIDRESNPLTFLAEKRLSSRHINVWLLLYILSFYQRFSYL